MPTFVTPSHSPTLVKLPPPRSKINGLYVPHRLPCVLCLSALGGGGNFWEKGLFYPGSCCAYFLFTHLIHARAVRVKVSMSCEEPCNRTPSNYFLYCPNEERKRSFSLPLQQKKNPAILLSDRLYNCGTVMSKTTALNC